MSLFLGIAAASSAGSVFMVLGRYALYRSSLLNRQKAHELFCRSADLQAELRGEAGVGSASHMAQVAANERHHEEHPESPTSAPTVALPRLSRASVALYRELCEEEAAVRADITRVDGWMLFLKTVAIAAFALAATSVWLHYCLTQ